MNEQYLVTITQSYGDDFEDIFSESTDYDHLGETLTRAYQEVVGNSRGRVQGDQLQVGDILNERVVTRLIDKQTTTSGRTFVLIEADGQDLVAVPADQSFEITRLVER